MGGQWAFLCCANAAEQANPMDATMAKIKQFLDYCATHDDAVTMYWASDLLLVVHSDAGYLNKKYTCI